MKFKEIAFRHVRYLVAHDYCVMSNSKKSDCRDLTTARDLDALIVALQCRGFTHGEAQRFILDSIIGEK